MVSADLLSCRSSKLVKLLSPAGYLSNTASSASTSSSGSAAECIDGGPEWLIEAGPGQRVNVTLWDFGHRFHADSAAARLTRGCIKYATVIEVGAVDREREKIVCGSRRGTTTDRVWIAAWNDDRSPASRLHVTGQRGEDTTARHCQRRLGDAEEGDSALPDSLSRSVLSHPVNQSVNSGWSAKMGFMPFWQPSTLCFDAVHFFTAVFLYRGE